VFPFRRGNGAYFSLRPMTASGLKKQWQEIRQKAELLWFRQYDLRRTAITRLAEADAPLSVIMSIAGHVSETMREHYTHISTAAKSHVLREVQNFRERKPRFQVPPATQAPGSFARSTPRCSAKRERYISSHALVDANGMPFSRFGPHYIRQATLNNFSVMCARSVSSLAKCGLTTFGSISGHALWATSHSSAIEDRRTPNPTNCRMGGFYRQKGRPHARQNPCM
jgi:Phage integrase family